ncbi:MAG: exo-alpha-sialidase, partial [Planctomycetia bacterium]|nr:exo-alpha-sialidase [Planctomycetia bacterium]
TPTNRPPVGLFDWGQGGYPVFNIPTMITTTAGSILAFAEGRATTMDDTAYALVVRRSTDGGITWSPLTTVYSVAPLSGTIVSNQAPVVDQTTGQIFVLFTRNSSDVFVTSSTDDGLTWNSPTDITSSVKVTAAGNPGPPGEYSDTPWSFYATAPAHGIQLQHGVAAGRLLVAAYHRETTDKTGTSWANVIYSDDHGQTWHLGGGLVGNADGSGSANDNSNESALVELPNGIVYMSSRVQSTDIHLRGESLSYNGGITWTTMSLSTIASSAVEGSLVRLDNNVLLFASPSNDNRARVELTMWISYTNAQTWVKGKVIYFGPSGYSDMTIVGPDTILLEFARGNVGGSLISGGDSSGIGITSFYQIGLARINLRWLQDSDPYQFSWYFNEQPPGTPANNSGPSIQDYGTWSSPAWPLATGTIPAPVYVAGSGSDSALELTNNADEVVLTQGADYALQLGEFDSLTAEVVLKTTDSSGVIIGTNPSLANWTLQIVGGKLQFSLNDTILHNPTIVSSAPINDGNWHHIAAVRDATSFFPEDHRLRLYVDGVEAATLVADTTTKSLVSNDPVTLGAYNTQALSSQLAFDVDTVRITRAVLAPAAFLPDNFVSPTPPAPPTYPSNAPTSIPGLQFWLPPYDPSKYFSDFGNFTNPLPLTPFVDMPTRSMVDASSNGFQVSADRPLRSIKYASDTVIGPYWTLVAAPNASNGSELQVRASSGTFAHNFDFVQNTGVFTISTFVSVGAETGGYMTLFDTSEALNSNPGFTLLRRQDGSLALAISGGTNGPVRFTGSAPGVAITNGQWFHVAAVGSGPGNPVVFYVTPVSAGSVMAYSADTLTGANGAYPTDAAHDLFIGGRSGTLNGLSGASPFNGGMVNEAIFNRALTPAQIQQLFLNGKGLHGIDVSATERDVFSGPVASFLVGNPSALVSDYSATITWGDSHASSGVISIANGRLTVSGTNTYADEGSYSISVTIDNVDGSSAAVGSTATVHSALSAGGIDVAATKGLPFSNRAVAGFTDAEPGTAADYAATINWGDGNISEGVVSLVDGVYVVSGDNTYTGSGRYPISVTVDDVDGSSVTVTSTAAVRNPISALGISVSPFTGFEFSGAVATFTDDDQNAPTNGITATIAWGDGHTSAGILSLSNGVLTVTGTKTYVASGLYSISVTINDTDDNSATVTATANVRDALSASGIDISAVAGFAFDGQVATFTDLVPGDSVGDYSATVAWGDGHTTAGVISAANGGFMVSATNTYAASGSFPLNVTINDVDGSKATASSTATVRQAITANGINVVTVKGHSFSRPVATFTDIGPSAGTGATASIAWGDGNTTAGAISVSNGVFTVAGTHTYGSAGIYPIQVTIGDADGSSGAANSSANVGESGAVIGRQLFFHNSPRFDVTSANFPGFSDDNAIAIDKTAYLPGSGAATFKAVSSYSRGINGVMIDIVGTHPDVTANDFTFKVGNDNSPASWASAPLPTTVTVRSGAGSDGSDRVELIWADGAIRQGWLEVSVTANANTGLTVPDVFFFGSAVGDSGLGDSAAVAKVDSQDLAGVQSHGASLAVNIPITNVFDFDKDGKVSSADITVAQTHGTSNKTGLQMINISAAGPFAPTAATAESTAPLTAAPSAGGSAIASALAATATTELTSPSPKIPTWIVKRLSHLELNHGPVAKYLAHLANENTLKARKTLVDAGKVADALDLDDHLLVSLLVKLGLK